MKLLAVLLVLALGLQLASAGRFPWESSRAIRKCVHDRECWTKGTTAVCGIDPHTHHTIGFPNRCYYACVNYNTGGKWNIDHWYHPSHKCYDHWTKRCSHC
jgi:hypothetical protein